MALALVILVDVVAGSTVVTLLLSRAPDHATIVRFLALAVLAVAYAEATVRVERFRRYLGADAVHCSQLAIWTSAAVLVLPGAWAGLLVLVLYAHDLAQRRRDGAVRLYRAVYTGATVAVSVLVGSAVLHGHSVAHFAASSPVAGAYTAAALVACAVVNTGLLMLAMALATGTRSLREVLPDRSAFGFLCSTTVLGLVTAELMVHALPLTPLVLVLTVSLHRNSLVTQLQVASRTDAKTGLLNPGGWNEEVSRYLEPGRNAAVLLVDLDRFKLVNDVYGHLAGDEVLSAVADCLRQQLRVEDIVGRFGGEEFVAVLADTSLEDALAVAQRIRVAIGELRFDAAGLGVTTSIGLTHTSRSTTGLLGLLADADTALYAAKDAGRNSVQVYAPAAGDRSERLWRRSPEPAPDQTTSASTIT